ncbi:thiamine phosphate synthase [Nocardioides nanhaiensis]|uniref:Thiamine-phosphate synthase n=1 Tax=Nocardioides nanhaiensis TaxID=1476871 RepID=A0ABP8VX94_9ACTN
MSRRLDLAVYLVTTPRPDLETVVEQALRGGVGVVQLRDKRASTAQLRSQVARLRPLCEAHGATLLVDDDLAAAGLAHGVHVGPDDVHPVDARLALGPDAVVGWSLTDLAQLDDEAALTACDYLAVSPVWPTPTKPEADAPWGLEGVRAVVARVAGRLPVVAIGGIDAQNAGAVAGAGADGVCVVSAICASQDPRAAAAALRVAVNP